MTHYWHHDFAPASADAPPSAPSRFSMDERMAARFWEKVDKGLESQPAGCWAWTGASDPDGYGKLRMRGHDAPYLRAHRLSYEALRGPVPDGLQLDHLCRNRWCVNPAHMEPVTSRENTLRGLGRTAQNARKTHCPQGHPLDGPNLSGSCLRSGHRRCLTCRNEGQRRRRTQVSA